MEVKTLRLYEQVYFPELSDEPITVKMDTGAVSGAIHADDIKIVQRDDTYYLSFRPFGQDKVIEKDFFRTIKVKSSNGIKEQRFTIVTDIIIDGSRYSIRTTLRDRSSMKTEAIIGSRFLRNKFIIDPR